MEWGEVMSVVNSKGMFKTIVSCLLNLFYRIGLCFARLIARIFRKNPVFIVKYDFYALNRIEYGDRLFQQHMDRIHQRGWWTFPEYIIMTRKRIQEQKHYHY